MSWRGKRKDSPNTAAAKKHSGKLLCGTGKLMVYDMEKPEVLCISFSPAFTRKNGCQVSQAAETRWKVWSKKDTAFGGRGWGQWALKLHTPKSMVPDGMYPQVLRQLANIFAKTLSFLLGRSQQSEEEITCHSYFQVWEKGRPRELQSGKAMELLILEVFTDRKVKKVIGIHQHWYSRRKLFR